MTLMWRWTRPLCLGLVLLLAGSGTSVATPTLEEQAVSAPAPHTMLATPNVDAEIRDGGSNVAYWNWVANGFWIGYKEAVISWTGSQAPEPRYVPFNGSSNGGSGSFGCVDGETVTISVTVYTFSGPSYSSWDDYLCEGELPGCESLSGAALPCDPYCDLLRDLMPSDPCA